LDYLQYFAGSFQVRLSKNSKVYVTFRRFLKLKVLEAMEKINIKKHEILGG